MNDITILIFLVCFVAVFGATFAFMWRMVGSTLSTKVFGEMVVDKLFAFPKAVVRDKLAFLPNVAD